MVAAAPAVTVAAGVVELWWWICLLGTRRRSINCWRRRKKREMMAMAWHQQLGESAEWNIGKLEANFIRRYQSETSGHARATTKKIPPKVFLLVEGY
jgi:hypothetical protein